MTKVYRPNLGVNDYMRASNRVYRCSIYRTHAGKLLCLGQHNFAGIATHACRLISGRVYIRDRLILYQNQNNEHLTVVMHCIVQLYNRSGVGII